METGAQGGTATAQAGLWGERATDWAEVMEGWNGWGVPLYRRALELCPIGEGSRVLDVGCGAGRFARMVADRGAEVAGLDATPELVEIARTRVLGGDFRVGEMESLPWDDDTFDLVTGFNSFFIAGSFAGALREAARVARPGGHVATTVFGRPDRCDSTAVFAALEALMRPPGEGPEEPSETSGPTPAAEGFLEDLAEAAGLEVVEAGYLAFDEVHPDHATAARGMLAAPPFRRAAAARGEEAVRAATLEALEPLRGKDGLCRLREEARYLVARVPG